MTINTHCKEKNVKNSKVWFSKKAHMKNWISAFISFNLIIIEVIMSITFGKYSFHNLVQK